MWFIMAAFHRRRRERNRNDGGPTPSSVIITNAARGGIQESNTEEAHICDARPMPLLYSLARSWAWEAVTFRCQTHPEEAAMNWTDSHGENVLHWSVFGRPPISPVLAMCSACPDLAKVRNNKGMLPLHVACSYRASTEVIRAVLDAYPEAAGEASDSGSFPLHFMCDYGCSVDSLRAIVQTGPGAASVLKQDRTFRRKPLQILNGRKSLSTFSRSLDKMRQARMTQRALRAEGAVGQEDELERLDRTVTDFRDFDFWQKTAILMLVEYQKRPLMDEDLDDARILQACIGITECPSSVQEFAILLYEDKLLTPDEDGQLPLHRVARDGTPSLLMDVLAGNTAAACLRDEQGLLPLEIAVRHRNMCCWSDGLGKLVEANPSALDELKLNDRLYPKIWSQLLTPDALFLAIRSRPGLFLRIDSGRDGI